MTTFAQLFPQGPRIEGTSTMFDDRHTVRRLAQMFGDPRDELDMTRPQASTLRLVELVDEASADVVPSAPPERSPSPSRRRRPVDALAITAATLAVLVMAATVAVIGVQMAHASPAASALRALQADEAAILNAYQAIETGYEWLGTAVERGSADAVALRAAIADSGTASYPTVEGAGSPGDVALVIADEAALAAALGAIDIYTAGLDEVVPPRLPPAYERGDINEDSLRDVGAAIDFAQVQLSELDAARSALREARSQYDELRPSLEQSMTAYAASFPTRATLMLAENLDAEPALRDAVPAAATDVIESGAYGARGIRALAAFRDAVVALVGDQLRVEQERREAAEQQEGQSAQPNVPPPGAQPTEPPTTDPEAPPVEEPPAEEPQAEETPESEPAQ